MKKMIVALLCAIAVWVPSVAAQTLISQFSFEVITPPDSNGQSAGPFNPDFGLGFAGAFHATVGTAYTTPQGNGSANAFSSNNWLSGDYYQFTISTVGFSNLFVTLAMGASGSGPTMFQLQYSADAGAHFSPFGSAISPSSTTSWTSTYHASFVSTFDLSGIVALNNNANAVFRLVAMDAGSTTVGTARVDDFILSSGGAITVPEPHVAWMLWLAGGMGIGMVMVRRRIAAATVASSVQS